MPCATDGPASSLLQSHLNRVRGKYEATAKTYEKQHGHRPLQHKPQRFAPADAEPDLRKRRDDTVKLDKRATTGSVPLTDFQETRKSPALGCTAPLSCAALALSASPTFPQLT